MTYVFNGAIGIDVCFLSLLCGLPQTHTLQYSYIIIQSQSRIVFITIGRPPALTRGFSCLLLAGLAAKTEYAPRMAFSVSVSPNITWLFLWQHASCWKMAHVYEYRVLFKIFWLLTIENQIYLCDPEGHVKSSCNFILCSILTVGSHRSRRVLWS